MAQRTRIEIDFVSDLSGLDLGAEGQTVTFGFMGVQYEIDLSPSEAEEFHTVMDRYISNGRRVGGRRTSGSASSRKEDLTKMREWARANGYQVADRGRISREIRDAYANANG
ncbi:MAG: Lsr2 family protein [Micrococcus sp.]|nr:Lsr2 family protein [Micrococcus sp.]